MYSYVYLTVEPGRDFRSSCNKIEINARRLSEKGENRLWPGPPGDPKVTEKPAKPVFFLKIMPPGALTRHF